MVIKSSKADSDKTIKIRLDIECEDSLFTKFMAIKEKTGVKSNTEVLRFSIKNTFDTINQTQKV